jgi:hypothetical protein
VSKTERWLLILWVAAIFWTLLAFVFPSLSSTVVVILTMLMVTIPVAMLLLFFPTLALYMTAGAPIYFLLRNKSRAVAFAAAFAVVAVPAFTIPIWANRTLEAEVARLGQRNYGGPITLPAGKNLAYLYDYGEGFDWDVGCDEQCQRLLFSGVADSVLLGDTSALKTGGKLKRYWLESSRVPCPFARLTKAYTDERELGRNAPYPRPLLADYFQRRANYTECWLEASAQLEQADVILAHWPSSIPKRHAVLADRLDPRPIAAAETSEVAIYVRQPGQLRRVMRQTHASANLFRVPLLLDAPFVFATYTPGGWARSGVVAAGRQPEFGLQAFLKNDLTVRDLP